MLRNRDKLVIWPAYMDKARSRSAGRIIPKKLSVTAPELKEIEMAARELGLNPVVEKQKAFPKSWWEVSGRVLVDRKGAKSETIRQIAKKIGQKRS